MAARANARAFRGWRIIPRMFLVPRGASCPRPSSGRACRPGHLRAGGAPAAGASRGGAGQRPRRRGPRAHVHPVGAGQLLHRRGRRRQRHWIAGTSSTGRARTTGPRSPLGAPEPRATPIWCSPPRGLAVSWRPLRPIRRTWDGPILLLGVQTVEDASSRPGAVSTASWSPTTAAAGTTPLAGRSTPCRRSSTRSAIGSLSCSIRGSVPARTPTRRSPSARTPSSSAALRLRPGPGRAGGRPPRHADTASRVRPQARQRRLQEPPQAQPRRPRPHPG